MPTLDKMVCAYGDQYCPCQDGDACHYEWSKGSPPSPHPKHRYRRPIGECVTCDSNRNDGMMPSHTPSDRCESGKRQHCTCDVCF